MTGRPGHGLDDRLGAACEAVRPGAVAADVGTDHGYLICALVAEGKCPRGYASDLRPGPLDSARREVEKQGLADRIELLLSDGLRELPGEEIDDVVIAGMGGELIGRLLTDVAWTRSGDKRFVLQPMTQAHRLRRFLYREGFVLLEERPARSGKFVYTVMTAAYEGTPREIGERFARAGLLWDKTDPVSRQYLAVTRDRLLKRGNGLARAEDPDRRKEGEEFLTLAAEFTARIGEM